MEKYVVLVNGGLWGGGKVFVGLESVKKMFKDEGVENWIMEEREGLDMFLYDCEMGFDEGIKVLMDYGDIGECIMVKNKELLEMGDDFVELSICKLDEE